MKKIDLSENEKKVLKGLSACQYEKGMFTDLSRGELYVASDRLKQHGLIYAHFAEGNILVAARISDEGAVYIKENPTLENPVNENDIKKLQKEELEYKKRIRKQEDIIRFQKLLNAIFGIIALIGWILFFFIKR
ncbi:MAG: hypothetical protein ACK5M3_01110 [Dysgonomonas sp.]